MWRGTAAECSWDRPSSAHGWCPHLITLPLPVSDELKYIIKYLGGQIKTLGNYEHSLDKYFRLRKCSYYLWQLTRELFPLQPEWCLQDHQSLSDTTDHSWPGRRPTMLHSLRFPTRILFHPLENRVVEWMREWHMWKWAYGQFKRL